MMFEKSRTLHFDFEFILHNCSHQDIFVKKICDTFLHLMDKDLYDVK
jgi:hypothetical protein